MHFHSMLWTRDILVAFEKDDDIRVLIKLVNSNNVVKEKDKVDSVQREYIVFY